MKIFPSIKTLFFCFLIAFGLSAGAVVSDFSEYLPAGRFTQFEKETWNTLLALFTQKAGDTMTGNLIFATSKGPVFTAGTKPRIGTIAYVSGGLSIISNADVTASTYCFLAPTTANAPVGQMISSTNLTGVGVQLFSSTPQTNSYRYVLFDSL